MYRLRYEDYFECIVWTYLDRSFIINIHGYQPLIDDHNKQHQIKLNMVKCWPTKNCWFCLITTVVTISIVDFCGL